MFRCQISKQLSDKGEKPEYIIVEKRKKEYYGVKRKKKYDRSIPQEEKIGEGWEIVKVLRVRKSVLEKLAEQGKIPEPKWV